MEQVKFSKEDIVESFRTPVNFLQRVLNFELVSKTQREILMSPAKRICICAGRRWGKTTTLAIYSLWFALTHKSSKIFMVGPAWEQADIFMDEVRTLLDRFPKQLRGMINIPENNRHRIRIQDSVIMGRSATKTSRSVRGHGTDLLIRDEDAFIPDDSMKSIRPVRLDKGAKELVGSSPLGHNHFYKDFHSKVYQSFHVPTKDNKFIDPVELEEEKQLLTQAEYMQEYEAKFLDDAYSVFSQAFIDAATNFSHRFIESPKEGIDYVLGVDLARRKDASVIFICHAEMNHIFVDYIKEFPKIVAGSFWIKVLNDIEELVLRFHVKNMCIDSTGIGDKPTEDLKDSLLKHNILCHVQGIDFTRRLKNSREGLINSLILKFERKEIHFPFNEKLIRQLKNIRYEASKTPSASMQTYGRFVSHGHDDYVMALVLAVYALPKSSGIFYTRSTNIPGHNHASLPMMQVTNKQYE